MLQLTKKASQSIYNQLYLQINQNLPAGFKDLSFPFFFNIFSDWKSQSELSSFQLISGIQLYVSSSIFTLISNLHTTFLRQEF